jgi:hypothetical protein
MQKNELDRLILGTNPLVGTNHYLNERARERSANLDNAEIMKVVENALEYGATGLNLSTDEKGYILLELLRNLESSTPLGLYVMVPDVSKYVSLQLSRGTMGLISEVMRNLSISSKAKALVHGAISLVTSDPHRVMEVFLRVELEKLMKEKPKVATLKAVLIHEALTDTAVALEAADLMKGFVRIVREKHGLMPGFVTRNFARFLEFCEKMEIDQREIVVMTPFNKLGFQMAPTRRTCEEALARLEKSNIIGMSILAGGQLSPEEGVAYLRTVPNLKSVAIGVSSPVHAAETFGMLRKTMYARPS